MRQSAAALLCQGGLVHLQTRSRPPTCRPPGCTACCQTAAPAPGTTAQTPAHAHDRGCTAPVLRRQQPVPCHLVHSPEQCNTRVELHSQGVCSGSSADQRPSKGAPTWLVYLRSGLPKMRDKPKSASFRLPAQRAHRSLSVRQAPAHMWSCVLGINSLGDQRNCACLILHSAVGAHRRGQSGSCWA